MTDFPYELIVICLVYNFRLFNEYFERRRYVARAKKFFHKLHGRFTAWPRVSGWAV